MLLPQVTICPATPMTINVTLLANTMRNQAQFDDITDTAVFNFAIFMIAGSGFQIFKPIYTIRRGRCFKTAQPLYQKSLDELGKLRVQLRKADVMNNSMEPEDEMLIFIGDAKPDIEPYPRYYIYQNMYNKFRMSATYFNLLPGSEHCSNEYSKVGKATCYLMKWLVDNLEKPYRCTYPYMNEIRNVTLPSCDAEILVAHYQNTVNAKSYFSHDCTLPCTRWEYNIMVDRTVGPGFMRPSNNSKYSFRADMSFEDLQYEQITEVHTLTFFGLLAQIGGQLSLFLGASIMSMIQLLLMLAILSKRSFLRHQVAPQENDETSKKRIFEQGSEASERMKRISSEGELSRANNFHVKSPNFYDTISRHRFRSENALQSSQPNISDLRTETAIY
ncbi:unnamed protein product [Anisakis simplex]|uniref:Uncharacterized protein n=1 Tax=Anisakis simplex TaxID=6269 RepID=A0A0M3JSH1_ANISI|nr:unnamed protein product [Anisakis simplex]